MPMTSAEPRAAAPSTPGAARRATLPTKRLRVAPRRESRTWRTLRAAGVAWPAVALAAALLAAAGLLALRGPPDPVLAVAVATALAAAWLVAARLRRRLLAPLAKLEQSVGRVCQGESGVALASGDPGVLADMARDIDSISEELYGLYEDMDSRVARQTARLAQKTASLKILYDAAATINQAQDLDGLLLRFLRVLKEMVNGRAATVRVLTPGGRTQLIGCIDAQNRLYHENDMLPVRLCVCGKALSPGDILCTGNAGRCAEQNGRPMFGPDRIETVTVPLAYHDEVLGQYTIYVERPGVAGREDIRELLSTIGNHLGVAVAKQRSDAEARRLSIIEERNALGHELHDSLAQTLAGLRLQVRMLEDTLQQGAAPAPALGELARIRSGLDEAHAELRELLNSFRAPFDRRGLVPALERLTAQFREDTGLHVLFQNECRSPSLSAAEEMQILRIAQEALTNTRKHARAHTVRVLLRCRPAGGYLLLLEDDGVGFEVPDRNGRPGEHIGLSIMEERARRLGGQLRIESEPGEGTRVELTYLPHRVIQRARRTEGI
jgi:two-component system nitrate/nitrite sensor histidine kinase NarX